MANCPHQLIASHEIAMPAHSESPATSASFDRLAQLCAQRYQTPVESILPDNDIFDTLKIDSFAAAELMSELELEFDVEIPDYELQDLNTFGALAAAIDARR